MRLFILIPCVIWFLTSSNWWRYALLSPITISMYQLWEICKPSHNYQVDEVSLFYIFPAILVLTGFLVQLAKKINYFDRVELLKGTIKNSIDVILAKIEYKNELLSKLTFGINGSTNTDIKKIKSELKRFENLKNPLNK